MPHTTTSASRSALAAILIAAGIALSAASCGKGTRTETDADTHAATSDSDRPSRAASGKKVDPRAEAKASARGQLDGAATDLQSLYDELGQSSTPGTNGEALPAAVRPAPGVSRGNRQPTAAPPLLRNDIPAESAGALAASGLRANEAATAPAGSGQARSDSRSAAQRRADAAAELASQLRPDITAAREPLRAAIPLIALDTIQPGAANLDLDTLSRAVSPMQAQSIDAVRDVVRALGSDPSALTGDPAAVSRILQQQAERLSAPTNPGGLAMGTVALCQKVESFGRFTPVSGSRLLAGRTHSMIVYSEVQNFAQRPTGDDGRQWQVDLGQEVELFLESDGSRQWRQPEAVVKDVSRSKRSDFFLVQRIDLPRNLTVGNYTLKLTVRDHSSGAEVQQNIPIQVVADASLLDR